jgi:hypothetical protein
MSGAEPRDLKKAQDCSIALIFHSSSFRPSHLACIVSFMSPPDVHFVQPTAAALRRNRHSANQPCLRLGFTARLAISAPSHSSLNRPSLAHSLTTPPISPTGLALSRSSALDMNTPTTRASTIPLSKIRSQTHSSSRSTKPTSRPRSKSARRRPSQ